MQLSVAAQAQLQRHPRLPANLKAVRYSFMWQPLMTKLPWQLNRRHCPIRREANSHVVPLASVECASCNTLGARLAAIATLSILTRAACSHMWSLHRPWLLACSPKLHLQPFTKCCWAHAIHDLPDTAILFHTWEGPPDGRCGSRLCTADRNCQPLSSSRPRSSPDP